MHSRIITTLLIAGITSLSASSAALADNPTAAGYDETGIVTNVPPSPPSEQPPVKTLSPVLPATASPTTPAPAATKPATAPVVAGATATRPASTTAPAAGTAPATAAVPTPTQPVEANAGSSLPFTGLDLLAVALGGLALLATGLMLRRSTRRRVGNV